MFKDGLIVSTFMQSQDGAVYYRGGKMSANSIALLESKSASIIPVDEGNPAKMIHYSKQLNKRDVEQIQIALNNKSYEMACVFLWQKSLTLIKRQLSQLGVLFIAEMLDRPDISEASNISQTLSDYDALTLAEDLGFIGKTGALRLRQSYERIQHFSSLNDDEDEDVRMTIDECVTTIRACVENVLGQEKIDASLDFQNFRSKLEDEIFSLESNEIKKLLQSPYFFLRTSIRVLLSLIKFSESAQLENVLANANLIIPLLWGELKKPEKFQIGRAYSEIHADGKSKAESGLKKALLKVKGFDYVPEDLRSNSYMQVAHKVLTAHLNFNNFYNEPSPMKFLSEMGSIIPSPALRDCMTAILSVKLGNSYGVSYGAQEYADKLLNNLTDDRWEYFLNDCLPTDGRILEKLIRGDIIPRWCKLVSEYDLFNKMEGKISNQDIIQLLSKAINDDKDGVGKAAEKLLDKLYNG
ncbi:hypothetical protein MCHI_001118 [Candidatus Magnetoovum chiemensis]|nr:hypothetical protein MCHI_001118 [Candidatus Magnetoovum chiemensis]